MQFSLQNKLHQALQSRGIHYCPIDTTRDSTCRPPKADRTCSKDFQCGYLLFKEEHQMCVLYHTRCVCSHRDMNLYRKEAEAHLKKWLPFIQEIEGCKDATITWSQQGRPYINTGCWDWIDEEDTPSFMCPLFSPYNEITLIPLTEE